MNLTSDSALRNSDETSAAETSDTSSPASAVEDSAGQTCSSSLAVTETLALPVLERHGETSMSSLDDREAQSMPSVDASAGSSSALTTTDGKDLVNVERKSLDDDDDEREMPQLTLYAT